MNRRFTTPRRSVSSSTASLLLNPCLFVSSTSMIYSSQSTRNVLQKRAGSLDVISARSCVFVRILAQVQLLAVFLPVHTARVLGLWFRCTRNKHHAPVGQPRGTPSLWKSRTFRATTMTAKIRNSLLQFSSSSKPPSSRMSVTLRY